MGCAAGAGCAEGGAAAGTAVSSSEAAQVATQCSAGLGQSGSGQHGQTQEYTELIHKMPFDEVYTNIVTRIGSQAWIRIGLLALGVTTICQGQNAAELQRASVQKQISSVQKQRETVKPQRPEPAQTIQPVIAPLGPPRPPACPPMDGTELNRMIEGPAAAGQVEPEIVREVARQESAFRPCAVSAKGAEGLMQLMPATQAMLGVGNPYDPEESLWAGAKLLKTLLTRYDGNVALALSAYNAGPARVDAADGVPSITETQNYVSTIMGRLSSIK